MAGFNDDGAAQAHARRWAVGALGEDAADLFVSWLCTLPDDEQARVADRGYPAARDEFERAFVRCGLCGGWRARDGMSCACFDNGCQ